MKDLCRLCGVNMRDKRGDGKPICKDEHRCAARVEKLKHRCCLHRRADHHGFDSASPKHVGARCTVPGCPCTGWIQQPWKERAA